MCTEPIKLPMEPWHHQGLANSHLLANLAGSLFLNIRFYWDGCFHIQWQRNVTENTYFQSQGYFVFVLWNNLPTLDKGQRKRESNGVPQGGFGFWYSRISKGRKWEIWWGQEEPGPERTNIDEAEDMTEGTLVKWLMCLPRIPRVPVNNTAPEAPYLIHSEGPLSSHFLDIDIECHCNPAKAKVYYKNSKVFTDWSLCSIMNLHVTLISKHCVLGGGGYWGILLWDGLSCPGWVWTYNPASVFQNAKITGKHHHIQLLLLTLLSRLAFNLWSRQILLLTFGKWGALGNLMSSLESQVITQTVS